MSAIFAETRIERPSYPNWLSIRENRSLSEVTSETAIVAKSLAGPRDFTHFHRRATNRPVAAP